LLRDNLSRDGSRMNQKNIGARMHLVAEFHMASQQKRNPNIGYLRSVCPKSVFPKTRPTSSAASGTPGIAVNAKYYVAVRSGREIRKGERW
jgi:hypothetical protein